MKADRYSIKEFNAQFPTDAACLQYIFDQRHPDGGYCTSCGRTGSFHRVSTRRCYSCANCGHQIHPCEGTIFHKSSTKLRTWFHVMFLMTASKNGVSAKEIERQTGVTYKTAWRMGHQVRKLMTQGQGMLSGAVEADETYIGGVRRSDCKMENKTCVVGMVERQGDVRAMVREGKSATDVMPPLVISVKPGSRLMTDESSAYNHAAKCGFIHETVRHSAKEYVRAEVHTNSIEGFWSQLKRSITGTFHQVGSDQLQAYVNEFSFRYNHRAAVTQAPIFPVLIERVGERTE